LSDIFLVFRFSKPCPQSPPRFFPCLPDYWLLSPNFSPPLLSSFPFSNCLELFPRLSRLRYPFPPIPSFQDSPSADPAFFFISPEISLQAFKFPFPLAHSVTFFPFAPANCSDYSSPLPLSFFSRHLPPLLKLPPRNLLFFFF